MVSPLSMPMKIWNKTIFNPNTFTGVVGKVRKKTYLPKEEGREDGGKSARGLGLEPGTYRVLGEGPQVHAAGAV